VRVPANSKFVELRSRLSEIQMGVVMHALAMYEIQKVLNPGSDLTTSHFKFFNRVATKLETYYLSWSTNAEGCVETLDKVVKLIKLFQSFGREKQQMEDFEMHDMSHTLRHYSVKLRRLLANHAAGEAAVFLHGLVFLTWVINSLVQQGFYPHLQVQARLLKYFGNDSGNEHW